VTDDKPGSDDLFEDLDKFFAPIRDVDWEPEETPPTSETPHEEHVAVRASDTPLGTGRPATEPTATPSLDEDDEEESWYDTSVLEPIDELLGTSADDGAEDEGEDEGIEEEIIAAIPEASDDTDQTGFFDAPDTGAEGSSQVEEPSESDLQAAAEHFAGSGEVDEEPIDEVVTVVASDAGTSTMDDLFGDEPVGQVEEDILSDLDEDDGVPRTVVVGSEGLGGPSWQEPTSVEVGADLDRRGPNEGERDVPAAVLTGVVLAGIALASLLIGKGAFAIVAGLVVLIAQGELFGVSVKHHQQPATFVGLVTGGLMIAGAYYHGEAGVLAMFALGIMATFLWFMAGPVAHRKGVVGHIGTTILNVAYIPLLASYLIITLAIGGSDGKALVVTVIGLTFIFDTCAFLVGSVWGGSFFQRPLAPSISPKKSLEGLIGATLITIIVAMALVPSFVDLFVDKRIESLLLALVVAVAATLGDLAESLIKRDMGIKDMGSILPGHGGVLDRIDSLLFVAPAAFLLLRVIFA
jgi:phosphatidate cytidylyltransferase